MNVKPNSIGESVAMNSELRVQNLGGPVARIARVRVGRNQHAAPSAKPQPWVGPGSADDWAGEFWEMLSCVVIWLCGLAGIGLCFR